MVRVGRLLVLVSVEKQKERRMRRELRRRMVVVVSSLGGLVGRCGSGGS